MLYDFEGQTVRKKSYISAQGPIRRVSDYEAENVDTCPDFWRMVWEQGVEVIVMLTKLSEDMREMEKCSIYWPVNVGSEHDYNGIVVRMDSEVIEKVDTFTVRHFTLLRGDEKKSVVQIQYVGWPDHGVPEDENDFIILTDMVDKHNKDEKTLVVHCSAGVGRSGTFCAIHSYVRYLRRYFEVKNDLPDINIPQRLIDLRRDRPKMIQTKDQYEFVYRSIYNIFGKLFSEFYEKKRLEEEKKLVEKKEVQEKKE